MRMRWDRMWMWICCCSSRRVNKSRNTSFSSLAFLFFIDGQPILQINPFTSFRAGFSIVERLDVYRTDEQRRFGSSISLSMLHWVGSASHHQHSHCICPAQTISSRCSVPPSSCTGNCLLNTTLTQRVEDPGIEKLFRDVADCPKIILVGKRMHCSSPAVFERSLSSEYEHSLR